MRGVERSTLMMAISSNLDTLVFSNLFGYFGFQYIMNMSKSASCTQRISKELISLKLQSWSPPEFMA